jgi:NAD-dependent deacetylase
MVKARYLSGFTGAGISVESGIPPFRGKNGLWNIHDPALFEINYFLDHPEESWKLMIKLFYDTFEKAAPNRAHEVLAELEHKDILKALITQNIDNLHYRAGSKKIVEYHGNSRTLMCTRCGKTTQATPDILEQIPPHCRCSGLLKPDFVFFGEEIPPHAARESERIAKKSDVMIVVGTTGQVYPAALIPQSAKGSGAKIVEVNPEPSDYTDHVTDILLQGKAAEMFRPITTHIPKTPPTRLCCSPHRACS